MAVNKDADLSGVPISVTFTESASKCLPPSLLEAFRTANWRAQFVSQNPEVQAMRSSTLTDNIARVDSQGAIYVPGFQIVELLEQSVTIPTTTGANTPVEISLSAPGITSLSNVIDNVHVEIIPAGAQIRVGPPRLSGNRYIRDIYRLEGVTGPPYPEVVVRMSGRLIVLPAPSAS